ncbi:PqqD family peptide modification chaperone [Enterococcus sp. MSG2901]|uniref:PqqD family peptide modification chaperone n=1 Tax=Candidatus Enterococcus courvalinii TaxID=2815329 RepID=A0ABS3I0I4_9ENTE|nr:PqqD family peptide modification chaperone [Enterococcus sp. MSG2901]MBO0481291.1 PqqD family peptide modification chaperone [Enterococcus sp. MSG2901]
MSINNLKPYIKDEIRQIKDNEGYSYLLFGEKKMRINSTGKQIVDLIDGKHSIGEIVGSFLNKYPLEDREKIEDSVIDFIFKLWKDGNYLNHDIDFDMAKQFLLVKNSFFLPFKMIIPKSLIGNYISPIIDFHLLDDSLKFQEIFQNSLIKFITINDDDTVDNIAFFNAFGHKSKLIILGNYNKRNNINEEKLIELKEAWHKYMQIFHNVSFGEDENLEIIIYHIKSLNEKSKINFKSVGVLRKEVGSKDLYVSSIII